MIYQSMAVDDSRLVPDDEERGPIWVSALGLFLWLVAGAVVFLPFALGTSPWDAVTLRVPGNQGTSSAPAPATTPHSKPSSRPWIS